MSEATHYLSFAHQALWVLALVVAPVLLATLGVGLVIGMIQAATSVNEQTLTFVPKLVVTAVVLVLLGGTMMGLVVDFSASVFEAIGNVTR